MGKAYGKCNLCGSRKFLNFAGLCKRCNKNPASSKITDAALAKELEQQQIQAAMAKEQKAVAAEEETTEAAEEQEPKEEGSAEPEGQEPEEKDGS